ncbi:unnamed protein product, partial [Brachionus calyciflorus]
RKGPRKLNLRDESYREIRKNPTLRYKNLAVDFNAKFSNVKVSKATIRRLLIKKGLESHTAVRKPLLTAKDRIKRYKWCKQRLNCTVNDWRRVIFSDESNFEVFNRKSRVIVKKFDNEKYHPKLCTQATKWRRVELIKDTLENQLLPSVELFYNPEDYWIFQQDGASAHTAHSIRDWFKEQNIEVLPWCPGSPDLSPIENLWSFIDAILFNTRNTLIDHLKQVLHKEWLCFNRIRPELNKFYAEKSPRLF